VAGNVGGHGSCTADWSTGDINNPSVILSSHVGGTDGTHCSITIYCIGG
jgi:hypothetical protein